MKGGRKIQKKVFFNKFLPLFGFLIILTVSLFLICSQTDIICHSDAGFNFLNEGSNSVGFDEGMNFIYEVQLSKVRTVKKWIIPIRIK